MEAEGGSEDGAGAGGAAAEGETDAVADGTLGAATDSVGLGVESAPAPSGVPAVVSTCAAPGPGVRGGAGATAG